MIIGKYSPTITSPSGNNCFSINTQVIILKTKSKSTVKHEKIYFIKSAPTTGRHFVRRGDYRLIVPNQSECTILYNHLSIYTNVYYAGSSGRPFLAGNPFVFCDMSDFVTCGVMICTFMSSLLQLVNRNSFKNKTRLNSLVVNGAVNIGAYRSVINTTRTYCMTTTTTRR